jgi:hypothetical protein
MMTRTREIVGEFPKFERLQAELHRAFAAPETSYVPLSAAEVIQRNRMDRAGRSDED